MTNRFLRVRPEEDFQCTFTHTFTNLQPQRGILLILVDLPEQQRRICLGEPRHIDAVLIAQPDGGGERGRDKRVGRQRRKIVRRPGRPSVAAEGEHARVHVVVGVEREGFVVCHPDIRCVRSRRRPCLVHAEGGQNGHDHGMTWGGNWGKKRDKVT